MLRQATLLTLIAMGATALAADKPAAQARERMEAEAHGNPVATVAEEHPVANVGYTRSGVEFVTVYEPQNNGMKPAIQARQRMEARGQEEVVVVAQEEHPVANVGYQRTVKAEYRTYEPQPWNNTGTKPAVRAQQK